jgi:hypothetical protein
MMDYSVSRTADGEIFVEDESGFTASFVNGTWVNKILFDMYDMRDRLLLVDPQEAARLYEAAKKAVTAVSCAKAA